MLSSLQWQAHLFDCSIGPQGFGVQRNITVCPPACTSSAKQGLGVCPTAWEVQCHMYCNHLSLQCLSCHCVIIAAIGDDLKDAPTPAVMSNPFGDVNITVSGSGCSRYPLNDEQIHVKLVLTNCTIVPGCECLTTQRRLSKAAIWVPSNGPPWVYFVHGHLHVVHLFGQDDLAS